MKTTNSATSDRVVPQFHTEAEEADWWLEQRDMVEKDMMAALHSDARSVRYKLASAPTNIITLGAVDEQAARRAAMQRGETYEAYVRRVVHEALQLEESA